MSITSLVNHLAAWISNVCRNSPADRRSRLLTQTTLINSRLEHCWQREDTRLKYLGVSRVRAEARVGLDRLNLRFSPDSIGYLADLNYYFLLQTNDLLCELLAILLAVGTGGDVDAGAAIKDNIWIQVRPE